MSLSSRAVLVSKAERILTQAGTPQPRAEAEFLLAAAQGVPRTRIIAFADQEVGAEEEEVFWKFVKQKEQGVPVAYITGEAEFGELVLHSVRRALVPRPETEELAQYCAGLFERGANPDILDLCTGSGAIGISLAKYIEKSTVTMSDISIKALEILLFFNISSIFSLVIIMILSFLFSILLFIL